MLWATALAGAATAASAQDYRLRVDTRLQVVAYRGLTLDSIPVIDTVSTPGEGPRSPDGFAVQCSTADPYCWFFRPGPTQRGAPATTNVDLTMWGLGVTGLSAHASGRVGVDFADPDRWPGTDPAVQLLEGYAEYARPTWVGRLGRQIITSRLGTTGVDGGTLVWRDRRRRFEAQGVLGWGLARGSVLPVTSPALNPLDDFQPVHRAIVAGAGAGWRGRGADVRVDYLREVDPGTDHFVSERVALQGNAVPWRRFQVSAGADYDMAAGWWGSAEAAVAYQEEGLRVSLGARRYRPHFELWSVWPAFSPVPYHGVNASFSAKTTRHITLRGRLELYRFDAAAAATPLVDVEDAGWRWEFGGTVTPARAWTVDAAWRREFGPGAATTGGSATVTYAPTPRLALTLLGAAVTRPLELRFNEALVRTWGVDAEFRASDRLRVGATASGITEDHDRPDAGAYDWGQLRIAARVVLLFGSGADLRGLPPAIRLLPGDRAAR